MGLSSKPVCKMCRREGTKLFLKSDRCDTPKCSLERRKYVPGQHGPVSRTKLSEYGIRLREKQKMKRFFNISESQSRRYYDMASNMHGDTGEEMLQLMERRFDNIVYRCGLSDTRRQSRLLVRHGHFLVNGKKIDIPAYIVKVNDVISIRERSSKSFENLIVKLEKKQGVTWIESDVKGNKYQLVRVPKREEMDVPVNVQFIVEYYSR